MYYNHITKITYAYLKYGSTWIQKLFIHKIYLDCCDNNDWDSLCEKISSIMAYM